MRRFHHFCLSAFSVTVLFLCSVSANANVITGVAAVPEGYYNAVDAQHTPDNILNALHSIIDNHTVIGYQALEPYYEQTDFYADTLWDMYSTCRFTMAHANAEQHAVCDGWNKEHLVCQSWLGSGPMVSDLFNVYPTDARINNLRSNDPYGVVSGSFSGFSKDPQHHGLGKLGTSATPDIGKCYEPDDRYKGDFARSFFYMVARYRSNTLNDGNGAKMFTASPTNLTAYSLSFLLDWHRNDPVSQKEIDRNQAIYGIQHNRNPFIDYPELVEYIWGNKVGQTIHLSAMVPTCEGGGYDPGTAVKYGVSWSVCGTVIQVDSVIANRAVTALPDSLIPCSEHSNVFVGWTTAPIDSLSSQAPAVLYKTIADFPVVMTDVTYYAVFAHTEEGEQVEPAVYTFDAEHQDGWTNTASDNNGNYWILKQGLYIESPSLNLAGLSSITMNMRSYGGSSYATVNISANGTTIATLTAAGNTLADQTWTNNAPLSGIAALRFESANATAQYGVGFKAITVNATGAGITYSDFLTSVEEQQAIENQQSEVQIRKILRDGQLLMQVNDVLYTITGQKVQ